ncbi:hypothetical protein A6E15_15700 [Natrinema saccharevitans]|uniref:Uncharacterized protein n=1 Tax=Natrinema saccharevitans TaxID=301967 RepID=A0A1S8AZV6_9EURY|nr:hypothetical protein [Natrinema saccharevitans]OLZ42320.1 hypothetical protein A6E15_15700 [Natrinema saccharevitans]
MVGTTLREIRHHIERLASDDGEYYVVCARSGERPVPVAGQRFPTRTAAADAVRATEQYRAALRRYDPQLPFYDPVVCQERVGEDSTTTASRPAPETAEPRGDESASTSATEAAPADDDPLISFCHDVSGSVFEALSARDHDAAERAIMETYLAAAEATTDPNTLCLVLLETMAAELETHLEAVERTRVLEAAAANLPPVESASDPVAASLEFLDSLSLLREYGLDRESAAAGDRDVWTVSLRGYAIECGDRRFPTLPIGIDVLRRSRTTDAPAVTDVRALGDGDWEFVLTSDAGTAGGLVCTRGERP